MLLLIIEDNPGEADLLAERLACNGFRSTRLLSGTPPCSHAHSDRAIAVIYDQAIDATSAVNVLRPLRNSGIDQPLLVLAARGDWRDKVAALDAGADDYIYKPVRAEEVAARLRALIRRGAGRASNQIVDGGINLDMQSQCAWLDGRCLNLSRNEFRLLRTLMLSANQVVPRAAIRGALSLDQAGLTDNAVEVQIARLRRKIGQDRIATVRGVGYRFETPSDGSGAEDGGSPTCETCKRAPHPARALPVPQL